MSEWQQLKALIDRVKRADEYFAKTLTDIEVEKALVLLERVLREVVELTLVLEKKHGRIDFSELY